MGFQYDDLPHWEFTLGPLPTGLLHVRAVRDGGIAGEGSGDDADALLTEFKAWARKVEADLAVERPVLEIDGSRFDDLVGFAREFSRHLDDYEWHGNLDAFNDMLRGGFGTPSGGFTLRWLDSERSKVALTPNLFFTLVEIIRDHGPGGEQADDGVILELR